MLEEAQWQSTVPPTFFATPHVADANHLIYHDRLNANCTNFTDYTNNFHKNSLVSGETS